MSELLQELNAFSQKITQAIELSDWETLSEILTARQERLESLLAVPLSEEEQRTVQGVLESIQAMDGLFIHSVQSKKAELLKDFQHVTQGQKGVQAYYVTSIN